MFDEYILVTSTFYLYNQQSQQKNSILRWNRTYVYSRWITEKLGENRQTSNVWINVFVHSRYSSLCAEYILGTSKFAELTNIGENIGEYRIWKSILAITRQFMRECPRMLTNFRYSTILAYSLKIGICVVPPLWKVSNRKSEDWWKFNNY